MSHTLETEQVSIVLLGSFNPMIFHPSWFAAHGLVPCDDNKVPLGVQGVITHPEVMDFTTDDFHWQVVKNRLSARALSTAFYDPLKDLVLGSFKILRHTPVGKMGLNRDFHFRMPDENSWNEVGDRLAPKGPWENVLEKPGMMSVTVKSKREGGHKGFIQVKVEPSTVVKPYGVYVEVNDHFEIADLSDLQGCGELMEILRESWSDSMKRAEKIAEAVVSRS